MSVVHITRRYTDSLNLWKKLFKARNDYWQIKLFSSVFKTWATSGAVLVPRPPIVFVAPSLLFSPFRSRAARVVEKFVRKTLLQRNQSTKRMKLLIFLCFTIPIASALFMCNTIRMGKSLQENPKADTWI